MPFFKVAFHFRANQESKIPSDLILSVLDNKATRFLGRQAGNRLAFLAKSVSQVKKMRKSQTCFYEVNHYIQTPTVSAQTSFFFLLKKKSHFCQYLLESSMFQKTDFLYIFIFAIPIRFSKQFAELRPNQYSNQCLKSCCLENDVAVRQFPCKTTKFVHFS